MSYILPDKDKKQNIYQTNTHLMCNGKLQIRKDKMTIKAWIENIKKLRTCTNSIARMATNIATDAARTQKSTRPIRILCAMENYKSENNDFDFVLVAKEDSKSIEVNYSKKGSLFDWFLNLNFYDMSSDKLKDIITLKEIDTLKKTSLEEYTVYSKEQNKISLLSFNFQLNQLLMLINKPILFPHRAYAKLFSNNKGENC